MREPVALSWSGGKDSALALHALRNGDQFDVTVLLTSVTAEYDRISIHGVRRALLERQVAALGLPWIEIRLEPTSSNEAYEAAFRSALQVLSERYPSVRRIAFGDLFLRDVRDYRDRLLDSTKFSGIYPLWNEPTSDLAERFIDAGFEATLVCTDNTQVAPRFAGRRFDRALLSELPADVDPCGENGEFHTFVHGGPLFLDAVQVMSGDTVERDGRFTYHDLLPA